MEHRSWGKKEPLKVHHFVFTQSRSSRSNIMTCVGLTVLPRVVLLMLREGGGGVKILCQFDARAGFRALQI